MGNEEEDDILPKDEGMELLLKLKRDRERA